MKTILKQAVILAILTAAVGLIVNTPLIVRWARGEFRNGFFSPADQGGYTVIGQDQAMDLFQAGQVPHQERRALRHLDVQ